MEQIVTFAVAWRSDFVDPWTWYDHPHLPHNHFMPPWLPTAVIYEINTRNFSPTADFRGVEARLLDLQNLGVTVLWLMPIHPFGQAKRKGTVGSPYAVRDSYAINPEYGTAADLHRLIRKAHGLGFRVIIDIVANHTSWDSILMEHTSFYKHDAAGRIIPPQPDWDDVAALDYANPQLRTYMINMLKHWLVEFQLDGFRCDVAGFVPTDFWEQARAELEKVKPDVFMLAEWDSPDLLHKAFDLDYSWPLHKSLNAVLMEGSPARLLRQTHEQQRARFQPGALHMRFSDNHDEQRAIARFGLAGALAASAFMFTLDGVPLLYNGMEVGDSTESGAPALFEKVPVLWQMAERRPQFAKFYGEMIPLRRAHPALQQGELIWTPNADDARLLTYTRRDARESIPVTINFSNQPMGDLPAFGFKIGDRLLLP